MNSAIDSGIGRRTTLMPIHGETVYSMLSRLHILEGNTSPLVTLKKWTGIRGYKPLSGLPTHLENIAENLSTPDGPLRLVQAHTHFPLYTHFLSKDREELLLDAMLRAGSPKARVGLLRNDMSARDQRRYCPSCVRSDIERYGVALWHREHTLPGLLYCSEHGDQLFVASNKHQFGDRYLSLPGHGARENVSETQELKDKLHYLAKQTKYLMERSSSSLISPQVYRRLLNDAGFITRNGRVRQKTIVTSVKDWLRPLKNLQGYERLFVGLNIERNWVVELVAGDERFHHPIKHIVLWGALGWDAQEVINSASTFGEQLKLDFGADRPINLSRDLVEELISVTGSIRKAANVLGVDITTLIVAADSFGIPVKRRPKKITTKLRVALAAEPGTIPAKELASRYKVSIATIYRIRRAVRSKGQQIQIRGI